MIEDKNLERTFALAECRREFLKFQSCIPKAIPIGTTCTDGKQDTVSYIAFLWVFHLKDI